MGGHYTVQGAISSGAMGTVHRALDDETGRFVAVKRLLDPTHVSRFEIEARLLAQLDHPRVVRVVDHFRDAGDYYIVMELIDGESLHDRLVAEGTPGLPVDEVIEWGGQACEALDYIHEQHIVHRDVKPQNLIVADRGVVLVDFGVARELGESSHGTIAVGTPRYMAPEVFSGGRVSERSDVFSLAVTLVTLIAGTPPSYTDRAPLVGRYADVSPAIDTALRAGMEFMPERRISSAAAFAEALGRPLSTREGASLATSIDATEGFRSVIEGIVRTAAGVFDAAAASIALADESTGGLVFHAAWGAGAREITGVRLARGQGIAGAVARERGADRAGRLPQRSALRRRHRARHELRADHDARRPAPAPRRLGGHADPARPSRRGRLRPRGRQQGAALRRPRRVRPLASNVGPAP